MKKKLHAKYALIAFSLCHSINSG